MNCDVEHRDTIFRLEDALDIVETIEDMDPIDKEEAERRLNDLMDEVDIAKSIAIRRQEIPNREWCNDEDYIAKLKTIDDYIISLDLPESRPTSPEWTPSWMLENHNGGGKKHKTRKKSKKNNKKTKKTRRQQRSRRQQGSRRQQRSRRQKKSMKSKTRKR